MSTVRTALIGCGKVGQIHAAALSSLPKSHFVAVCDRDHKRADHFSERYGTEAFTNVETMICDAGVQAVVIGTPHPQHAEPVISSAESGVHALVEKPLAANL